MIVHHLKERREGVARRAVQSGGRGEFAQFTYAVTSDAAVESVAFVFRDGPEMLPEFVPRVEQGAEAGRCTLAECGEWFGSVTVEIVAMRNHDVGLTQPIAFQRLGNQFVAVTLREACVGLRSLDPRWRTPDVLALAHHAHESGDVSGLPALADALEEAGCDFALLLDHCRSGCAHEGGCWAVQLTLASPGDVLL